MQDDPDELDAEQVLFKFGLPNYYYYLQEPTDIPSRKKLMRWVCARGWCVRRGNLL